MPKAWAADVISTEKVNYIVSLEAGGHALMIGRWHLSVVFECFVFFFVVIEFFLVYNVTLVLFID